MKPDALKALSEIGITLPKGMNVQREPSYFEDLRSFIHSHDFAGLENSIINKRWDEATGHIRRMQQKASILGIVCFQRWFLEIHICIGRREKEQALGVLSMVASRRVQIERLLKELEEASEE